MKKTLIASLAGAAALMGLSAASAGEWRLNPRACPDLVEDRLDRREDRIDRRVTTGRRDRIEDRRDARENRRDERVTICPASAFYYVPSRGERLRWNAPAYGHGRHAARHARQDLRRDMRWDRRAGRYYHTHNGLRVYINL